LPGGALARHVPDWRAMPTQGPAAGELTEAGEDVLQALESRLSTGRPLATADWIAEQEAQLLRSLAPKRRGPTPNMQAKCL
jgi:hypothetical protein